VNKSIILSILSCLLICSETSAGHEKDDADKVASAASRSSGGKLEANSPETASSAGEKKQQVQILWDDLPEAIQGSITELLDRKTRAFLSRSNKGGYKCVQSVDTVTVQRFLGGGIPVELAPGSFSELANLLGFSPRNYATFSPNAEKALLKKLVFQSVYKTEVERHFAEFNKLAVVSRDNKVLYSHLQSMAKAHSQEGCTIDKKKRVREVFLYDLFEGAHPGAFMAGMQHYFGTNFRIFGTDGQIGALREAMAAKIEDLHHFIQGQYVTLDDVAGPSASTKNTYLVVRQHELEHRLDQVRAYFAQPTNANKTLLVEITHAGSSLSLNAEHVQGIQSLAFVDPNQNITAIGDMFLRGCRDLTELDLSPLSNVTSIGSRFLVGCSGLTALDLRPLSNITSIGNAFLDGCSGLAALDLRPLSNITSIGNSFLDGCSGLAALDLSPLSNVTSIGAHFLRGCRDLTELDLSPLSNVTSIGSRFLGECRGLTALDLSPLSNLTSVELFFLFACDGLTALDLSPLSKVTSVGDRFLARCTGLTALDLGPLSNVTSIGRFFLSECSGLKALDLSPLSNVTSIGHFFLWKCDAIEALDRTPVQALLS